MDRRGTTRQGDRPMNAAPNRARVLLAEDNEDHAFFTVRAFKDAHGAELVMETVADGEQLLEYLRQEGSYAHAERPHLIVLDLKMPKMGGLEVLAEMQQRADLRTIP